ncbi:MAG: DUF3108 domain-containing protein [Acidobacteria bacterium]|nr:DUF3108 domain-containing protein [Acidobacteriota bacterium]
MTRSAAALCLGAVSAAAETLYYTAHWRGMTAGIASIDFSDGGARLTLETTGFVGRLYKVKDVYTVNFNGSGCAEKSLMEAEEGKRREEIRVSYTGGKVASFHRDLVRKKDEVKEMPAPDCNYEVIAALRRLRGAPPEIGRSVEYPMANERKVARVKVEAQRIEWIRKAPTIRYEAHLMNNVLYRRSGHLHVWLTQDARRIPVRVRVRMPFYIGTVTLELSEAPPPS